MSETMSEKTMPVIFAAHGAPMLLDDEAWVAELSAWAGKLPKPRAILSISAHWEDRPLSIGATKPVPLIYDFSGFPERFYRLEYRSPGGAELAAHVRSLLSGARIAHVDREDRGLDHGTYIPLLAMYPAADIPVLQISMPGLIPRALFDVGRALAPLRKEEVLIFGSGFLTHNMRYLSQQGTPRWAKEFDAWCERMIKNFDVDALLDFQKKAPAPEIALPTWEHYAPLLVSAGAAHAGEVITFPITGWWMDSAFTKRSVQFG